VLTVYDMVKGLERGVEIEQVVLLEKRCGRSGYRLEDGSSPTPVKSPDAIVTVSSSIAAGKISHGG
jgi:hypothetical protein